MRRIKQFFRPHLHVKTELAGMERDGSIIYERECLDCGAHLGFTKLTSMNGKIKVIDLKEGE